MTNIINRDKLLRDIANGLNYWTVPPGGVWGSVALNCIGVVLWAGEENVLAAELYEVLLYLACDAASNADNNWANADRAEVCPM